VNKLDRTGADYFWVLKDCEKRFKVKVLSTVLPVWKGDEWVGCVDIG